MPQACFILPEVVELWGRDSTEIHYLNVRRAVSQFSIRCQQQPCHGP